jgi:hypothetical protein
MPKFKFVSNGNGTTQLSPRTFFAISLSVPILSNWPVSTIPQVDNTLQRSDRRSNSTRRFLDIVARRVCHDGARNKAQEMIRSWGKCVLADEPAERRHQGEQVVRIHISARRSLGLSTEQ